MAKRKLTIETLTKLGRRKLAELLIAEAAGNRRLKQSLNLAIAAEAGPEVLSAGLRKCLATLSKSRSMLSYDKGRELIGELDGLRTTIVETIGPQDARLKFELLWELIDLHPRFWRASTTAAAASGLCFEQHATTSASGAKSKHGTGCAGCDGVPQGHQQQLWNI